MFDVHVAGLRSVLDALRDAAVRVIYTSSTGVYGQDTGEWVDEASVCDPDSDGGRACRAAEALLFAHARGDDAVVLRLAGLYGPARVPHAADIRAGKTLAGAEQAHLNLIHVDDAARTVVAAATVPLDSDRTFLVSDGHPPTRGAYAAFLAAQLGVGSPSFEGGRSLGKRVCNDRAVSVLELALRYPSYREGLAAIIPAE
jgi:nucleoside-diphosphate-sugar epimerase